MSLFSFMGALEMGFIFALVALGVLLSFRILDFPDLTADGSFPLGGAVAAVPRVSWAMMSRLIMVGLCGWE